MAWVIKVWALVLAHITSNDWIVPIQYPQDMIVMQELIWSVKPDLIIETSIVHGEHL
jgi:cephalosporin hydroxylase